jgi:drug/metabolite transporter (DMT)-like permease
VVEGATAVSVRKWLAVIAAAYGVLVLVLPESAGRWVSYGAAAALILLASVELWRHRRKAARP